MFLHLFNENLRQNHSALLLSSSMSILWLVLNKWKGSFYSVQKNRPGLTCTCSPWCTWLDTFFFWFVFVFFFRKNGHGIDSTSSEFSMHLTGSWEIRLMRHRRRRYPGERITHAYLQTTFQPLELSLTMDFCFTGMSWQRPEHPNGRRELNEFYGVAYPAGGSAVYFDSFWWDEFPVCSLAWLVRRASCSPSTGNSIICNTCPPNEWIKSHLPQ